MIRRVVLASLAGLALSPPAAAAPPPETTASVVAEALDTFCKPFFTGATTGVRAKASAAGWGDYGMEQYFKEGGWGRINVTFEAGRYCRITVPVGSANGRERALLDLGGVWAKANGFTLDGPRATTSGPAPYDQVIERWSRAAGPFRYTGDAIVNRRRDDMLVPDVEFEVKAG
jgi:hypothetical protein